MITVDSMGVKSMGINRQRPSGARLYEAGTRDGVVVTTTSSAVARVTAT